MTRRQFQAHVGEKLRAARTARGWSQLRLAVELGVTAPAVHYWETGEHGMSYWNVTRLDRIFGDWR